MFKRILVAWDGSEHATRALAEAIDVARSQDASMTLLTIITRPSVGPGLVPPVSETELLKGAEVILASGEALVPEGISVSTRTATGHPGTEILKRAAAADHDLIVMGSRGRGAVRSAVLGSVSHFVLNHGTVPMLIVHDNGGKSASPPADRTMSAMGEEVARRALPRSSNERLDYGQPLEFGYFLTPDADDPLGVLETARLVDGLGYDLIGVQDHPYQARHLDTQSLLAAILAQTTSVRVFAAVGNLPLRLPAVLAKSAATLDLLSGGRFELGIGAGGYLEAAHAMGAPVLTPGESLAALEEAVAVMRAMWSGERRGLRFDGRHYQLEGVHPGPAPAHPIQVWIGANMPRALALTGRVADGWVSPLMNYKPPREAAQGNLAIDRAAREAGRDPREIRRIFLIPGAFTSRSQAPATDSDQTIVGPPEHWAEVLTHFALDLGFGTFVLVAPPDSDTLSTFIEDVAPEVRERVAERRATSPERAGT